MIVSNNMSCSFTLTTYRYQQAAAIFTLSMISYAILYHSFILPKVSGLNYRPQELQNASDFKVIPSVMSQQVTPSMWKVRL